MLMAADAREITNDLNSRMKAREEIENLSPWIEEQALKGKNYLLFFLEHVELKDFILQEFKDLGYIVERIGRFYYKDCPLYRISW